MIRADLPVQGLYRSPCSGWRLDSRSRQLIKRYVIQPYPRPVRVLDSHSVCTSQQVQKVAPGDFSVENAASPDSEPEHIEGLYEIAAAGCASEDRRLEFAFDSNQTRSAYRISIGSGNGYVDGILDPVTCPVEPLDCESSAGCAAAGDIYGRTACVIVREVILRLDDDALGTRRGRDQHDDTDHNRRSDHDFISLPERVTRDVTIRGRMFQPKYCCI
jgi:hypothetical protein